MCEQNRGPDWRSRGLHYWRRLGSFGDVADPGVWSRIHDEGTQVLENIANIRVPVIAAIEGRAHIHSDYALLANVIVAAAGATFQDVGHYAVGVVPGDGIFTTWSYRAGAGRAEAFLLNPQPLPARAAYEWGVVAEVVPNGKALSRAGVGGAVPEGSRSDTPRHTRSLHSTLEGASCGKLATDSRSKERRRPISSNQSKPGVNLENPHEEHVRRSEKLIFGLGL